MDIPDGYAQLNFRFTGSAAPTGAECTLGINLEATSVDPEALGDLAFGWVEDSGLKADWSSQITLSSILVKYGPTLTGPSGIATGEIIGTYSSSDELANTSFLFHKNTAFGGRAGKGRMYWPGAPMQEADSGGVLDGTFLTAVNTDLNALYAQITGDSLTPVLLHGDESPLTTPTPLLGFSCDAKLATQRRRLRR
jgi:hypothetical protein